jgi:3-oxoacyl-[acyl-carrier-protein] synthase III
MPRQWTDEDRDLRSQEGCMCILAMSALISECHIKPVVQPHQAELRMTGKFARKCRRQTGHVLSESERMGNSMALAPSVDLQRHPRLCHR